MFTRRKKSYGVIIGAAIVITLCILIVVIAWPTEPTSEIDPSTQYSSGDDTLKPEDRPAGSTDNPSGDDNERKQSGQDNPGEGDNQQSDPQDNSELSGISSNQQSYYIVKYVDGFVRVFFFDSKGNSVELEKTGIAYDVLNPSDQKLLSNGIKASSQEELATILQDFEG